MHPGFEAVIGLEVHCQLSTDSKIFCACRARLASGKSVADVEVNSNTCPICAGHPGTLPVLNRKVVEYAVKAGLATNCRVNSKSIFARKNYYYPDLPKGYQISQYEHPICEEGWLQVDTRSGQRKIRIQRIHMEEDAGKNVHMSGFSLVNLNRAGVPLIEIVSGPDMKTAEEAGAYLRGVHAVVTYLGICDGNMQEGNFRCDANVSVMPRGSKQFGTRVEIKNVNSFRFVERAIDYEISRQIETVESGKKVVQETRTYDSGRNITASMRSKEEAHDYRYFPDPDLIPLRIEEKWIEEIRAALPELPAQKRARFVESLGLTPYDAGVLTNSKELAEFYETSVKDLVAAGADAKSVAKSAANLVAGEVARLVNEQGLEVSRSRLRPKHIADVVRFLQNAVLSSSGAKQVLASAWESGEEVSRIVESAGLKQVSDADALGAVVDQVIAAFPGQAAEFRAGKDKLLGFFVGQAMKQMGGKANPALLQELVKKKLT